MSPARLLAQSALQVRTVFACSVSNRKCVHMCVATTSSFAVKTVETDLELRAVD